MVPDLSIVLNVHDEIGYIVRTLRSTEEAARFARALGARIELVIVLDRPSAEMCSFIGSYDGGAFDDVQSLIVDLGSLGLARNAGISTANGEFVVLCDADDLISFNSFHVSLELARRSPARTIVVLEYVFAIGAGGFINRYSGSESISALHFLSLNPYPSRILARRDLLMEIPFIDVSLGAGYAFEDWHLHCELLAAGARFAVAPGTILFYRIRPQSLSEQAGVRSTRQIPPSALFAPEMFVRLARLAGLGVPTDLSLRPAGELDTLVACAHVGELLRAARRIDPTIDETLLSTANYCSIAALAVHSGVAYFRLCATLAPTARFTHVVFAPHESKDPGVNCRAIASVLDGETAHASRAVLVLGERAMHVECWETNDEFLSISQCIALADFDEGLTAEEMDVLCLKLVQTVCAGAQVHLGRSAIGRRFWRKYGDTLTHNHAVLHRFEEPIDVDMDGALIADLWPSLPTIVAHSQLALEADRMRFGRHDDKWQLARLMGKRR